MKKLGLDVALLIVGISAAAVAVSRWQSVNGSDASSEPHVFAAAAALTPLPYDSTSAAAALVAKHDPFRFARSPAATPFVPASLRQAAPAQPAAPRPAFALRGIIGGPPWQAIVDGVPGEQPGMVLRPNATFTTFVVVSVTRDTVVIRGSDTTWHLTIDRKTP